MVSLKAIKSDAIVILIKLKIMFLIFLSVIFLGLAQRTQINSGRFQQFSQRTPIQKKYHPQYMVPSQMTMPGEVI